MTKKIVPTVLAVICFTYTMIENFANINNPSLSPLHTTILNVTLCLAPVLTIFSACVISKGKNTKQVCKYGIINISIAAVAFAIFWILALLAPYGISLPELPSTDIVANVSLNEVVSGLYIMLMIMPAIYAVTFFIIAIIKKRKSPATV